MFNRFLPKEVKFFDFFEQHALLIQEAAQIFLRFITTMPMSQEMNDNPVKKLEHQADDIAYHCLEALHKSFITPFQQEDIFRIISRMDDIIDAIDEAFDCCIIYKIKTPTPPAQEMATILAAACEKVVIIIKALRNRSGQEGFIKENCRCIKALENRADEVLRRALGTLFEEENDIKLLIKWKEIYKVLEQAADYCDDVSNIVEGIMLEYD